MVILAQENAMSRQQQPMSGRMDTLDVNTIFELSPRLAGRLNQKLNLPAGNQREEMANGLLTKLALLLCNRLGQTRDTEDLIRMIERIELAVISVR